MKNNFFNYGRISKKEWMLIIGGTVLLLMITIVIMPKYTRDYTNDISDIQDIQTLKESEYGLWGLTVEEVMNHTCKNVTYEKVDESTMLIKGQLSNGNKVKIYININSYGQYSIDYVEVKHIFRTVKLNHHASSNFWESMYSATNDGLNYGYYLEVE